MRCIVRVAVLLLLSGCRRAPQFAPSVEVAYAEQVIPGAPMSELEGGEGPKLSRFGGLFLLGAIRNATGPVYLYIDGIKASPAVEAEFYFVDDQSLAPFDPGGFIGSVGSVEGSPLPRSLFREVNDFEVNGVKYAPRSAVGKLHELGIGTAVTRGTITFDQLVVSTEPPPKREARLAREAASVPVSAN